MRCILSIILTIVFYAICCTQTWWKQDRFILGTFNDPPYNFIKRSIEEDSARFQLAKDAHFNLLTGTQEEGGIDHSFEGMRWAIMVAQRVGLQYLVSDRRIFEAYNNSFDSTVGYILIDQYKRLSIEYPNTIYGFNLCDEPQYRISHFKNVSAWKWFVESAFTDKLVYLNLAPSYAADQNWGGIKGGNRNGSLEDNERLNYEKYLNLYIDSLQPAVISFDHYPFFRNGGIRRDYFYNLRIIRQKAGFKPFWAYPMTVDHLIYIDPQEAQLAFMYFCPIAYGAKGLVCFSFWPYSQRDYRTSLFDLQGKKTKKYEIVAKLNLYIQKVIAPIVMRIPNVAVYHSSNYPYNQQFLIDTINADSKVVASISDEKVMLGVFRSQKETYLFIVNKSLDSVMQVQIGVKGIMPYVSIAPGMNEIDEHKSLQYERISTSINTSKAISCFSIPLLLGGEGRLVRIR